MEYLTGILLIFEKLVESDEKKERIKSQTTIEQAKIFANKDKFIASIAVTGAVVITGTITSTINKLGGKNHE